MNIDIQDPGLEARLRKQMEATGARSVEEALGRLLHTQEEQDRWLWEHRTDIDAKIRLGLEQLDRGEGIPANESQERLRNRKAAWLEERRTPKSNS